MTSIGGLARAAETLAIWSTESMASSSTSWPVSFLKAGTSTARWASSQLPVKVANTSLRACAWLMPGNSSMAPRVSALPSS